MFQNKRNPLSNGLENVSSLAKLQIYSYFVFMFRHIRYYLLQHFEFLLKTNFDPITLTFLQPLDFFIDIFSNLQTFVINNFAMKF